MQGRSEFAMTAEPANELDAPVLPFLQRRFRNEAHSHTLEGAELDAYEAQFDAERARLHRAVTTWAPPAPVRQEYAQLRQAICSYNCLMRNGYARTCAEFEAQELRGKQEAFKARVRHDLLPDYDELARACKNLWVPQTYLTLQRKARKAMARTYPELFDLSLFEQWRASAPEPEPDEADAATSLPEAPIANGELTWLLEPVRPSMDVPVFDLEEITATLEQQPRACDARKLLFALLRRRGQGTLSLTAVQTAIADLRVQLHVLEQQGRLERGAGLLTVWDEPTEPTWRTARKP